MDISISNTRKISIASLLLTIAMILPIITAQIPQVGKMLCPMHFPILLCGFICGPWYGLLIGFVAPLLRFMIFGMPVIFPTGIMMCFELAAYGFFSGVFYARTQKIFLSLIFGIIAGRLVRIIVYWIFNILFQIPLTWEVIFIGGLLQSLPGTTLQIIFIPPIVKRYAYNIE